MSKYFVYITIFLAMVFISSCQLMDKASDSGNTLNGETETEWQRVWIPEITPDFEVAADGTWSIKPGKESYFQVLEAEPATSRLKIKINMRPNGCTPYKRLQCDVPHILTNGWTLNIGDSVSNNGYGGDAGNQSNDCELQIVNGTLAIYADDSAGNRLLISRPEFVKPGKSCQFDITNNQVRFRSADSISGTINKPSLFALNGQDDAEGNENYDVYIGLNRTIGLYSRNGSAAAIKIWLNLIYTPCTPTPTPPGIHFYDINLETAIRNIIGKPTGNIYDTDVLNITSLFIVDPFITDLRGMEYFSNLQSLYLRDDQLTDLSPLAELTAMRSLEISSSQVTDITPLHNLTNLRQLNLRNNPISDIYPLAGLVSLRKLELDNNPITDFSPLLNLPNLTYLELRGMQLRDISFLNRLPALEVLDLAYNPITDITPLANLNALRELYCYDIDTAHIDALASLTSLTSLAITDSRITDITPLAGLTALTSVSLTGNQITDLAPLANLTALKVLVLDHNQISNITPLQGLVSLIFLDLDYNQISDLSPLSRLFALDHLFLMDNQISDLSPLSGLVALTWLFLPNNQISDISALKMLTSLEFLNLNTNNIADISPIIDFIFPDIFYICDNPLNENALNIYIPYLIANGVNVRR